MYKIVAIAGLLIRQFIIPNPFVTFGGYGKLYNLLASGIITFIAYKTVGFFYTKGEAPVIGSAFFTIFYIVYSGELWLVLKPYPNEWLMLLMIFAVIIVNMIIIKIIRLIKY
ncbi:MAG: hypothetical protein J6X97_09080 [Lachnospiraceae bacterium]|nr:hypothetical protein [Lachnospiraceae bacterium]